MADVVRDRFIFVRLASRTNSIEVGWDHLDKDWSDGLAAIRDFARRRQHLGPEPRIQLPRGHPHREEYLYDPSSEFRYVNLAVLLENDVATLHQEYGKDVIGDPGTPGPLRPWTEFMSTLLGEVERRS